MMKTEKRKANVGERILITDATGTNGQYKNGDILSVREIGVFAFFGEVGTVRVKEHSRPIYASEYEVIVEQPKKSARITALESQVATLKAKVEALESASKYPLTAKFERESSESNCEAVDAILADIERKAKPTLEALLATYPSSKLSANERRADVIRYAKAFVADIVGNGTNFTWDIGGYKKQAVRASFHVNTEKGAVTALIHGHYSRHLYEKGIAKCDPDDVFNADIGKAIALARALGVDVPVEFVKAVQPTASVGQRIKLKHCGFATVRSVDVSEVNSQVARGIAWISDDTDAVYGKASA